jgi:hypothetical protein
LLKIRFCFVTGFLPVVVSLSGFGLLMNATFTQDACMSRDGVPLL